MKTSTTLLLAVTTTVSGFTVLPSAQKQHNSASSKTTTTTTTTTTTALNGLFDGVKEAFSAPALERTQIDAERETPIDRWMGWSVVPDQAGSTAAGPEAGSKVAAGK